MIQGGGFTKDLEKKKTDEPIKNEAKADVPNKRGTLAMARLGEPHSATAQFFINVKDNDFLNHRDDTPRGYGYCVFAEVTKGMDIVDKIRKVKTHTSGRYNDVPVELVVIESIRRVEKDQKAE